MLKNRFKLMIVLAFMLLSVACGKTTEAIPTPAEQFGLNQTSSAATIEAMTTSIVATDLISQQLTAEALAMATPTPSPIPSRTPILPTPSETPVPTTQTMPPSPTLLPVQDSNCNLASFIEESIPDGAIFPDGFSTWTLKNIGSCTGRRITARLLRQSAQHHHKHPISSSQVAPGQNVTITLPLNAPLSAGTYRSDFKLRSAEGVLFAFRNPETTFWLEIQVRGDNINLADTYCSATWESPIGQLHCPGQPGIALALSILTIARFSTGYEDDETVSDGAL